MRLVIFGRKWLAAETLGCLAHLPTVEVVAVCPDTSPDRLVSVALNMQVPVVALDAVPPCDLGIAACCQRFLPPLVRERCRLGVLAYHPSLLPRHRGRDAVRWTVAMRDAIAGGSVYWMDDGADTGPIEAQDWCHVLPGEDAAGLWRRALAPMGLRLVVDTVSRLASGGAPRAMAQDERLATFEPAFSRTKLGE